MIRPTSPCLYDQTTLPAALLGLIPTLLFTVIGARIRDRLDNATFRRIVFALLALWALNLVVQGLHGLGVIA